MLEGDIVQPQKSSKAILLIMLLISIPRLFRERTRVICYDRQDVGSAAIRKSISDARQLRSSLQEWYKRFVSDKTAFTLHSNLYSRPQLSRQLVLYYVCTIYCNRLNTCTYCWEDLAEALKMEEESQLCASYIVSLNKEQLVHSKLQASLLLVQKLPLAEAVVASAEEWRDRMISGAQRIFVMPKQTFQRWCDLLGRTTV